VAGSLAKPVDGPTLAKLLQAREPAPDAPSPPREACRRVTALELELALDDECIYPEFQPKISLATGRPLGVEALARWRSPVRGTIAPDAFIAIAEAAGEMPRLTERMLSASMAACGRWRGRYPTLNLAVNVPPSVIGPALATTVTRLLAWHRLPPSALTLEITESCLLSDSLATADVLTRLRIHGVQLSIDDFGTGYASLATLLKIPFNEIKLDRLFVSNALRDPDADRILRAVIAMSHEMGLHCVAEGIDSADVRDRLRQYHCDAGQGWFWARAMDERALLAWLDGGAPHATAVVQAGGEQS
jgi:EAL domain-containing protein (putative c-di-GMP-specific phosphodiesterase class I)